MFGLPDIKNFPVLKLVFCLGTSLGFSAHFNESKVFKKLIKFIVPFLKSN